MSSFFLTFPAARLCPTALACSNCLDRRYTCLAAWQEYYVRIAEAMALLAPHEDMIIVRSRRPSHEDMIIVYGVGSSALTVVELTVASV